ncbi:hypothetical protein LTR67_008486 [Exophiala xenobiotica]
MPSSRNYRGGFVFVNGDGSTPKDLAYRDKVRRQVSDYRRWKKRQRTRQLLESSKFLENVRQDDMDDSPPESSTTTKRPILPPLSSSPVRSMGLGKIPHLLEILLHNGNSDPFDALPEQVTATVNALLAFERDCVYPAIKKMEYHITPRETTFSSTWYVETKAYLYDGMAVHSYLSRIATNMYMVTGASEYLDAAHEFRYKGVTALRKYLDSTPNIDVLRLYRGLLILLFADSVLGDRHAMDVHVAILKDIFNSHYHTLTVAPSFNLHHFISIIYHDVQNAVVGLSRISFDLGPKGWVVGQFVPLWNMVSATLGPHMIHRVRNVNSSLSHGLQTLFVDVQEIIDIIITIRRDPSLIDRFTWFHVISKITLVVGRLMTHYADLDVDKVLSSGVPDHTTPEQPLWLAKLEEAAAALCAIYWVREIGGIENVYLSHEMRMFTANPIIMAKLRTILEHMSAHFECYSTSRERCHPQLLVWVLWTGATTERSMQTSIEPPYPGPGPKRIDDTDWFLRQFCCLTEHMRMTSWSECRDMLERFLSMRDLDQLVDNNWCMEHFGASRSEQARPSSSHIWADT